MADEMMFSAEELRIDEGLGYPKAYAKLCRDRGFGPYSHGPPFTFTPYALQPHQALRAKELDEMFPIIDVKAKPTAKPKIFVSLLWKQLNHLGNAGFDPETFRVDPYGNVLYFHADSASPLAWDIDHWFPCSRGGLTVSTNLRLLQWQVCKKKHNNLEFLVPWWDLQVGISINQFLSIFASSNSDFRHRGFSLLFSNGENEELNDSQTVELHRFPQHFNESKKKSGLAPAAVVASRKEINNALVTLQSIDINTRHRSNSHTLGKSRTSLSKENETPDMLTNPYQAIVIARDSLRHREETSKIQSEIEKLDEEVVELKQKNEEEKTAIQDLELVLIRKRRRAEKSRRLAEAQSSYRAMLEKMIRDAMHQSVVYKEQVRLNQAASNALMARLEAQKAISDLSERELHKKFKQRDELEKQIRPEWEQARKRSRMNDTLCEGKNEKTILYLPGSKPEEPPTENKMEVALLHENGKNTESHLHKELREYLEEEQKAYEAGLEDGDEIERDQNKELGHAEETEIITDNIDNCKKLQKLRIEGMAYDSRFTFDDDLVQDDDEDDEESRKQRGKGNVEKWLQMLLEGNDQNPQIGGDLGNNKTDEIIKKMNLKYPQKEILKLPEETQEEQKNEVSEIVESKDSEKEAAAVKEPLKNPPYKIISRKSNASEGVGSSRRVSFDMKGRSEKSGKDKDITRSESARILRRIPSSPSIILGMKKSVDCIRRKPAVMGDDDDAENYAANDNFIKSSFKTIKKVVQM